MLLWLRGSQSLKVVLANPLLAVSRDSGPAGVAACDQKIREAQIQVLQRGWRNIHLFAENSYFYVTSFLLGLII